MEDGTWYTRHDAGGDGVDWTFHYENLSREDVERLEGFFESAGGRLRRFTFVDPMANLLTWSGDLTEGAWEKGLTQVAPLDGTGPDGEPGGFALKNNSGAVHGVAQTVAAPAGYRYVVSAWLRGEPGTMARLAIGPHGLEVELTAEWRRHQWSALVNGGAGVRFAFELEPGGECAIWGQQAEAQIAASAYQKSGGRSAVYPEARFEMDEMNVVAEGPEQYRTVVRITSRG